MTSTTGGYTARYSAGGAMTCRAPTSSLTCTGTPTGQPLTDDALDRQLSWQNQANSPTTTASYGYDGAGSRVEQQVTSSGITTTTYSIGSYEEISVTGSTTTTTKYYATKAGTALAVNGTVSYLLTNGLSSVTVALSSLGSLTATQLFTPYGSVRYSSGTMPTSKGFTGQRLDSSGLNYFNARYYDSTVGQFTSADTVQGLNRYTYTGGNPETRTDPSGNCFIVCAIAGAVAGAIVGTVAAVSAVQEGEPIGNAIAHAAVDVALGAVAGATIETPGAMVGLVTSVAGVALSAATGGINLRSPAGIQSAFESIAIGTIAGAASGALGNSIASSLSGYVRGSAAFARAAWNAAGTYAVGNGLISVGGTLLQGGLNMLDGRQSELDPGKIGLSFLLGAGASFFTGVYGFNSSNPTGLNNAGGGIQGVVSVLNTAASSKADQDTYGGNLPPSNPNYSFANNGENGGNDGNIHRGGITAF